jgi:hypothetical protein
MEHEPMYTTPEIRDYGDLAEVTASCFGATNGDTFQGVHLPGPPFGTQTSVCISQP